jgi:cell wall-associated NlpC family hydrolase
MKTLTVPILLSTLFLGACATAGRVPARAPGPTPSANAAAIKTNSPVVRTALALAGTRYRWGGSDPSGVDCSGLIWYVYAQNGVVLPRTLRDQYLVGNSVRADKVEPGDLLFFRTSGSTVGHVGIAVDAERFVHAPNSRTVVKIDRFADGYWSRQLDGARRLPVRFRAAR